MIINEKMNPSGCGQLEPAPLDRPAYDNYPGCQSIIYNFQFIFKIFITDPNV